MAIPPPIIIKIHIAKIKIKSESTQSETPIINAVIIARMPEKIVSRKITKPISFSERGFPPARINLTK